MKLIWSKRALSDLLEIGEFISRHAPEYSRRNVQHLVERAKQAAHLPASGRLVPEYQDENLREIVEGNYRIVYEVDSSNKKVTVVTVFEAHRLITKDLK